MREDKIFLTYNQQMKKLRNDKHITCEGSSHKQILIRAGYFNIVNGYKNPFVCGQDTDGNHIYITGTSIAEFQAVKHFDDELRHFLLKYISQIEEELRALTGYKFDECNDRGHIPWYSIDAYSTRIPLQSKMSLISKAYNEISRSKLDYVKFYTSQHEQIPTWIMIKAINFSTFIDIIDYSKRDVPHALCKLYELTDDSGRPNVKLLIGSLHWMRRIRNSCAHNERVYCLSNSTTLRRQSGRIVERYIKALRPSYRRDLEQKVFDLIVYFKYYLPDKEYALFVKQLREMLLDLQSRIHPNAFENVRGSMGIKNLGDLDIISSLPKNEIEYNRFDKQ